MSRIMPPVSTAGSGFLDSSTSLSQPTSCSLLQSSSVFSPPPFLCYAAHSGAVSSFFFTNLESKTQSTCTFEGAPCGGQFYCNEQAVPSSETLKHAIPSEPVQCSHEGVAQSTTVEGVSLSALNLFLVASLKASACALAGAA